MATILGRSIGQLFKHPVLSLGHPHLDEVEYVDREGEVRPARPARPPTPPPVPASARLLARIEAEWAAKHPGRAAAEAAKAAGQGRPKPQAISRPSLRPQSPAPAPAEEMR